MDSTGIRRRDTTKGPPLRILSLDGGGVRGYSMLIIIQELMHRTYVEIEGPAPRRDQIPKPCDHFDLIVGTGTGGLIALMLGRLRLDLETCKELYVRLTRMVFETDKTIAGIPYRSTLFKASKLEEAIKEAVREHTVYQKEGNDGTEADLVSPISTKRHSSNASVVSFSARSPQAQMTARPVANAKYGNPNARLYDARENRTKTAVTAIYKGSSKDLEPALLRSYDSRREPPPEFDCKIWEAGRATCAIGLAFKPIQIGQSVFHDDGAGTFNPSPQALDEAVINEWPGREVGVFFSVGTGRRPKSSDANSSMWYEGFLGEYAEARRRLIAKIEGCEKIHEDMLKEHLGQRGVNFDNYYRLNVEIGVGEFGMNEWNRLADISTGTRKYLSRPDEQKILHDASAKLAKIHKAALRYSRLVDIPELRRPSDSMSPLAVELPGDIPPWPPQNTPPSRASYESGQDQLTVPTGTGSTPSPRSSGERIRPPTSNSHGSPSGERIRPPTSNSHGSPSGGRRLAQPPATSTTPGADEPDRLVVMAPTPAQFRTASGGDKIASGDTGEQPRRPNEPIKQPHPGPHRIEPPPLPPKTPLLEQQAQGRRPAGGSGAAPPYPIDDEAPPPTVNMARKPEYRGR